MLTPLAPQDLVEALANAVDRLARTLAPMACEALEEPSRVIGTSRRAAIVAIVARIDRQTAALHRHGHGRAPADPRDARRLEHGDGTALAAAVDVRIGRMRRAARHALDATTTDERDDVRDELEALLARVELAHVALDACYDLGDLPPASVAACARVSGAYERMRDANRHGRRIRASARRRGGIAWPPGRRSR